MIELYLTDALRDLIADAVKDLRLASPPRTEGLRPGSLNTNSFIEPLENSKTGQKKEKGLTSIKVWDGWLPPKENNRVEDFPFVAVRLVSGSLTHGMGSAVVDITVGTFGRDDVAYRDCVNVSRRIVNAITTLENNILGDKYNLKGPVTWQMPFDQELPFYQMVISTTWDLYSPEFNF